MNKTLIIRNYKCFDDLKLLIKPLTVLTGKNGVGKSSVTQSLRLLFLGNKINVGDEIHLNSSGFNIGTFDEIIPKFGTARQDNFWIGVSQSSHPEIEWGCEFDKSENIDECEYIRLTRRIDCKDLKDTKHVNFVYLSAERFGPRLRQGITDGHKDCHINVGVNGEYCAELLANNFNTRIDDDLIHPSCKNSLLTGNLEKWMSEIVGNIEIRAERPPRLSPPYLEFRRPGKFSDWQFPTNHGFGISYVLPIILAGLTLEKGGTLIVDSPEAHLHPSAQTAIAQFLTFLSSKSRNIIIETHSDHVLDGIRISVTNKDNNFGHDSCIFHYLDRDADGKIIHKEINPNPDGSLPYWPDGFFDQIAINLQKITLNNL